MTSPFVFVMHDKYVGAPDGERKFKRDRVSAMPLVDALKKVWQSDAHLVQYAPLEIPFGTSGETIPVRLDKQGVADGEITISMVCMIGDIDGPNHVATPEWRAETEPKLIASGLAWYATRGGYRVITLLPQPYEVDSLERWNNWREVYLGWREYLIAEHGIMIDHACADPARVFRLPNVMRDKKREASEIHNIDSIPPFDINVHYREPAEPPTPTRSATTGNAADDAIARARVIAENMPASVEHHGGDAALFKCACEIATQLPEDAAAIERVLGEVFNPRCVPPWPSSKVAREAQRAAERSATPEARFGRRAEARAMAERERVKENGGDWRPAGDDEQSDLDAALTHFGGSLAFDAPDEPIEYLCEGLGLARSDGKISIIAGQPGGAKGPIADHLAVCFSLGLPAFGTYPCERVCTIVIDCEGARLTRRRIKRMARAMGHDPSELDGRLYLFDAKSHDITAEETQRNIRTLVRSLDVKVMVVDSYTSAMMRAGVESSQPQYAILAQFLGSLDILALAVTHAVKTAAGHEPSLADIAYSTALASLGQTVMVVYYPDRTDQNLVHVGFARAPEETPKPFCVRFSGAKDEPLAVRTTDWQDVPKGRAYDAERRLRRQQEIDTAGRRVIESLRGAVAMVDRQYLSHEMADVSTRVKDEVLKRLDEAGMIERVAGQYRLSDKGQDADERAIGCALRGHNADEGAADTGAAGTRKAFSRFKHPTRGD